MGVGHTVILASALGIALLITAAAVAGPLSGPRRYRPALITLLIGLILTEAYVIGYTLAVEEGAAEARGRIPHPELVKRCPPYTVLDDAGTCVVDHKTNTGVPVLESSSDAAYTLNRDVFSRAPDGRTIADGLMQERAPGMDGRDPQTGENDTRDACCHANDIPFTELSTLCPRSDLLTC
jgi:hypothetical protein